jgi:hypothetical protein
VFNTLEEAREFCEENLLDDTEEYSIWCIEYDTDENEIDSYPIWCIEYNTDENEIDSYPMD